MKDNSEIAYQCLTPTIEDHELNMPRKKYTWWVEAMNQAINFSDGVPDLVPVMEFADDNKYKLYYLMYIGFCNGVRSFRVTNNKTGEVINFFTCNHLSEWVGEIPEEEKIKPEKVFSLFLGKKYHPPPPGIPIMEK